LTLANEVAGKAMDRMVMEMIGVVRRRVEKPARSGGKFAFLTLSDPSGETEIMVMPEMLSDMRERLEPGMSISVRVEVRKKEDEIRLSLARVVPLEEARLTVLGQKTLKVRLGAGAGPDELAAVMQAIAKAPGAERGDVVLNIPLGEGKICQLKLPEIYPVGISAQRALKSASCVELVEAVS
jgi:DNA polymerase-3 subunit alpha